MRRNGGAAGVDGETVADIDAFGVDRWLGALARDLKEGSYRPHAVRQVLIPKKQQGKFRPLGIPCLRDRVVQTAAMLVLSPIFEADLQPEQYAYRPGRDAHDAVRRVHRLLTTGHREVVDADLSDYFGQIPHADLMKSIARRVSDGRLLGWVKAWLEMAVEEDDGRGGRRHTNRARHERKGTPQGSPISPLFSNIYMRRFILGWKVLGYARHFKAEIVNCADDLAVLGRAPWFVILPLHFESVPVLRGGRWRRATRRSFARVRSRGGISSGPFVSSHIVLSGTHQNSDIRHFLEPKLW